MVHRVVEVSENLGMKVNIEKTETQHTGRAHRDFNIVIKNQTSSKQSTLSIWEETSVQRKELFQRSKGR